MMKSNRMFLIMFVCYLLLHLTMACSASRTIVVRDEPNEPMMAKTLTACGPGYFTCLNGECIDIKHFMDGHSIQCSDCTDETEPMWQVMENKTCHDRTCASMGGWRCDSGQCIRKDWYMDKVVDCLDCSDESVEYWTKICGPKPEAVPEPIKSAINKTSGNKNKCGRRKRQCLNGICIWAHYWLDGRYVDCTDCSDEKEAHWDSKCEKTCEQMEGWKCNDGQCIRKEYFNDGEIDCEDCSDEDPSIWSPRCPNYDDGTTETTSPKITTTIKTTTPPPPTTTTPTTTRTAKSAKRAVTEQNGDCDEAQLKCMSGQCINESNWMDGEVHCDDCTDEQKGNWTTSCVITCQQMGGWECKNGQCIHEKWRKDGEFVDCEDCSDEDTNIWGSKCPNFKDRITKATTPTPTTTTAATATTKMAVTLEPEKRGNCDNKTQFECMNGQCIDISMLMDGKFLDCNDCTDEPETTWDANCTKTCEQMDGWRCANEQCIRNEYFNDTKLHCVDCSDEHPNIRVPSCPDDNERTTKATTTTTPTTTTKRTTTPTPTTTKMAVTLEPEKYGNCDKKTQFQCMNGQCIDREKYMNRDPNCEDCTDELEKDWRGKNCTQPTCEELKGSPCNSGQCIHRSKHNDGNADCVDCSDEKDHQFWTAECNATTTTVKPMTTTATTSDPVGGETKSTEAPTVATTPPPEECTQDEFECASSKECVHYDLVNNGDYDCQDGSDESVPSRKTTIGTKKTTRRPTQAPINPPVVSVNVETRDPIVTSWTPWSECDFSCGGCGREKRTRTCLFAGPCRTQEERLCNARPCGKGLVQLGRGGIRPMADGCCALPIMLKSSRGLCETQLFGK